MKFKLDNDEIIENKIIGEPPRKIKWLYETVMEVNGKSVWMLKRSMIWAYKNDPNEKYKPPHFYKKVGDNFYVIDSMKAISL